MTELVANVQVGSPRRYLDQLCSHVSAISGQGHRGHHPGPLPPAGDHSVPQVVRVDRDTPDHAVLTFESGTCELQVDGTVLRVTARAEDERLEGLATSVAHRLETIGRRDHVRVEWIP